MNKRKKIIVISLSKTKDGYGGWKEAEVIETVLYAIVESNKDTLKGHNAERQSWVISHTKIDNPKEKRFRIDGELFKCVQAVQNRRRWFYQIEGD